MSKKRSITKQNAKRELWQEYGFASKEEFQKKYPNAGKPAKKTGSKVSRQRRKLLSKQEQMELDRFNKRGIN